MLKPHAALSMHLESEPLVGHENRVLVVVPAYNEDRFIGSVVVKLRSKGYPVLVVDDGSTDSTAEVASAAGARLVRHDANLGKAAALRSAIEFARRQDVRALVVIDGDSQHDPAEVSQVLAPILTGDADMVVGSRFAGILNPVPRWRIAGQRALSLATNLGSGLRVTDTQSGFRAFSRRALDEMELRGDGFSVESEMQFEAQARGWRVLEVPIHVHYQLGAKRNPVWQGVLTLDGILRVISQRRPLLFFSLPGMLTLLVGLALGLHVVDVYQETLQLGVGLALITVLLCIVGIIAVFVGIMLHAIRGLLREAVLNRRQRRG